MMRRPSISRVIGSRDLQVHDCISSSGVSGIAIGHRRRIPLRSAVGILRLKQLQRDAHLNHLGMHMFPVKRLGYCAKMHECAAGQLGWDQERAVLNA